MLTQARRLLFGFLLGTAASGVLFLVVAKPRGSPVTLLPPPTPPALRVHVAGAVLQPGVYALPPGSIVEDAIEAAGGPAAGADLDRVNLAAPLEDGQRVLLPTLTTPGEEPEAGAAFVNGQMNLNEATADDLETLPGIGPGLARAILEYREAHGPFQRVEDLLLVPGIGPSRLEQLRELVTVG